MPKKGFTTITVPAEVEKRLREQYAKNRPYLLEKYSVTTFSGFLLLLSQRAEEHINANTSKARQVK